MASPPRIFFLTLGESPYNLLIIILLNIYQYLCVIVVVASNVSKVFCWVGVCQSVRGKQQALTWMCLGFYRQV